MSSNRNVFSEVKIRPFRTEDYDAVIVLWKESALPSRLEGRDSRQKISAEIEHQNSVFLVAEENHRIVGSIFGTHEGRKGWINRLAVSPSYRKQGIAAKLTAEVEKRFSEQGIDIIACLIEEWNTVSLDVFERLGYVRHPDIFYFSKRKNQDV